jgi:hypothetical protein
MRRDARAAKNEAPTGTRPALDGINFFARFLSALLRSSAVEMQGCGQGLGRQLALARAKLDLSMPPEYCPNMQYHVVMVGFMTFEL